MPEDFASAATRHFRDGVLLEEKRRILNADQLFGFAAECAIKSALVGLPGFAANGFLASKNRKHIDKLWNITHLQGIQKRYPSLVAVLKNMAHPFGDWSTDQRYEEDGTVSEETLKNHHRAAARVLGSVGLSGARGEE